MVFNVVIRVSDEREMGPGQTWVDLAAEIAAEFDRHPSNYLAARMARSERVTIQVKVS